MNIIDLAILLVLGVSVLFGVYYGFSVSLFKIISFVLSWFLSLIFHSSLSRYIVSRFLI